MKMRMLAPLAVTAAAGLVLAGCSSSGDSGSTTSADTSGSATAGGDITFGVFNGWDEANASSLLWENILDAKGYNVSLEYADPAPVFQALADGDYDLTTDVWLPKTHASYLDQYGDSIVELGAWFDSAKLTVAVNADAPIDSLADLAANADQFGNTIVGIEPGAGLTAAMEDDVIPTYGLDGMDFITSSTPAMLAELDTAMANGENIVVTLWEPHWAYGAYDLKNLEDPEGALGDAESIYTYSRTGFSDDFPQVAEWMSAFTMDSDHLYDLENALQAAGTDADQQQVVADWVAANQEWVDSLTA
ncbi:glycine betaine ABC transporter substrate-binding protein [Demequina capsici]|uniref:Glycine betaine ABC transporter substrate-binding protein n=1 Tax=Demequina capsici TaxID=3075620 RepID=A0AA96JAB3_9MICO|nr:MULTISPECIES: glycine betaine ABC transporter substrate-binding protein [unclassified Demequina]WNM25297.1 glycine betaine ABC transporter substrate-binding protein [Demequina sp. OYTSA14]WNM28182.1 glycine betaine ABC transporter substrate-binding protein [Demequina sp. PMTSA13]